MNDAFNDIYHREILPSLLRTDGLRKKSKNYLILILWILLALIFLPFAKSLNLTGSLSPDQLKLIGFAMVIVAAILGRLCYSKYKEYKILFKTNVVEKIIKTMFVGFDYNSSQFVDEKTYRESQLFPKKYDLYKGEDYFLGKIGQMKIEFSELQTSFQTATTDTGGGSQTKWSTIFHGFFMHAELHRKIATRTFVFPIVPESIIGEVFAGALKKTNGVFESRGQILKLENSNFEKHFIVFADDLNEARHLISTTMQERLTVLREKFHSLPCVAFINNRLFIALQNNADHFEPRLWNAISKSEIYFFYELFQSLISIAQDLEPKQN